MATVNGRVDGRGVRGEGASLAHQVPQSGQQPAEEPPRVPGAAGVPDVTVCQEQQPGGVASGGGPTDGGEAVSTRAELPSNPTSVVTLQRLPSSDVMITSR